jgi:hypothetical protein
MPEVKRYYSLDDADRHVWDDAWRSMPHHRMALPSRVDVGRDLLDYFGSPVFTTIALNPPQFAGCMWRKSELCPICGYLTVGAERLPASIYPTWNYPSATDAFSIGIGVWVHASCFENCPPASELAPVPW